VVQRVAENFGDVGDVPVDDDLESTVQNAVMRRATSAAM
jgi:hypothetical protein